MNSLLHHLSGKVLLVAITLSWVFPASAQARSTLNTVLEEQILKVGLINDRHHYHLTGDGPTGFDYGYARGLADYLGVTLQVVPFYSEAKLYKALTHNTIHVAAPRFSHAAIKHELAYGPVLFTTTLVEIGPENEATPCSTTEPQQRQVLPYLQDTVTAITGIDWQQSESADSVTLLTEMLSQAEFCTILPNTWSAVLKGHFPSLNERVLPDATLSKQWLVRVEDTALLSALYEFTHLSLINGSLAVLRDELHEPAKMLVKPAPRELVEHINTRYPAIQLAAEGVQSTLDGSYIAAIDYLLNDWQAAQHEQAKESDKPAIRLAQIGRKLDTLQAQLPARIQGTDRTWFILAAYYLGVEHIDDARQLTVQAGANPDLWVDVKQQLPLLQTDYSATRAGFANGAQAVTFVDQVRYVAETLTLLMKGT
ncbi:hypothetical protein EXU34_01030 [Alteromonas sp. ZYF713]|nr:hypothetical protein [Alteromonas sp. ZYF713]